MNNRGDFAFLLGIKVRFIGEFPAPPSGVKGAKPLQRKSGRPAVPRAALSASARTGRCKKLYELRRTFVVLQ